MNLIYTTSAISLCTSKAHAQGQQLWFGYQVEYPFANAYLFEVSGAIKRPLMAVTNGEVAA